MQETEAKGILTLEGILQFDFTKAFVYVLSYSEK